MSHDAFEVWDREGRPSPMPAEVEAHLSRCSACARALAEAEEVRSWFGEQTPIDEERALEMRFELEAAARTAQPPQRSRRYWLPAAAVLLLAGGIGAGALLTMRSAPPSHARVVLEPGTRHQALVAAPHEEHRLVDGVAVFQVDHLDAGETFAVLVGPDTVEVRGTRFEVRAKHDVLEGVRVFEGRVAVKLVGEEELLLNAGEAWQRPAPERAELASAEPTPISESAALEEAAPEAELEEPVSPPSQPEAAVARRERPAKSRGPQHARERGALVHHTADAQFRLAWELYQSDEMSAAAAAFERLLARHDLGDREADVLFWAAQARLQTGSRERAHAHLRVLVGRFPSSIRAADARRQLAAPPR